jgi:pilus assembly protein CpaF
MSDHQSETFTTRDIKATIHRAAESYGLELSSVETSELLSILERERRPFGILQELIEDHSISDIIVQSYSQVHVQIARKNYATDIRFSNQSSYEAFVERLLLRAGTTYSTKQPIADGSLNGNVRIHAVHRSIAEAGPYLTIRVNRFESIKLEQLVTSGLGTTEMLQYLSSVAKSGNTLLVVGEVGTGKTTLVRAIANELPGEDSILVIEDTPEVRLMHPHVRYIVTREDNAEGTGKVPPSSCIRAGMRMAMNRIIFGEIRDAEAAESFIDVCASGHPGISTVHGRSAHEGIIRLELFLSRAQGGVARSTIQEQIAAAVDVLVHLGVCPETGKRRIMEVREMGSVADGSIRQRTIFQYTSAPSPGWKVVSRVSMYREVIEPAVTLPSLPALLPCPSSKAN